MAHRDRRTVLALLALAVAGQGLRCWLGRPGEAPGAVALFPGQAAGAPLAHRDSALALSRPLGPGERIDLDRAPAAEIGRLPRVGPALARRIEADRAARGPFGSLEGLDRVAGIGPGLLAALKDRVMFSGIAVTPAAGVLEPGAAAGAPLDLNRATAEELTRLPGIGPALAGRIVAWRERHGPFPRPDSLLAVPGIGPTLLKRLEGRIAAHAVP